MSPMCVNQLVSNIFHSISVEHIYFSNNYQFISYAFVALQLYAALHPVRTTIIVVADKLTDTITFADTCVKFSFLIFLANPMETNKVTSGGGTDSCFGSK